MRVGPAEGEPQGFVQLLERLILAHGDHAHHLARDVLRNVRRRLLEDGLEGKGSHPTIVVGVRPDRRAADTREVQLRDGSLRLSPSDLSGFLACAHLTQLDLRAARGELSKPRLGDPYAELIRSKGDGHEAAYLARLEGEGRSVVRLSRYEDEGFDPDEARRLAEEAIRAGTADVIYQAYLTDGTWRGFADFLERRPGGTYEPVDTKLARTARPGHVLQLCFYAEQLERIQGRLPEEMHLELGSGARETFRTRDHSAYYRRVRERFLSALAAQPDTYPWPCAHCSICDWRRACHAKLVEDDSPVLVAGLGRADAERLVANGLPTLESLGRLAPGASVDGYRPERIEPLRHQAELQLHRRRSGEHRVDHLELGDGRGFQLLPEPSAGDVWLDLEGHPFYEPARGLEYLFGWCYRDEAGPIRYEALWGRDRAGERAAFERFVDWLVERRRPYPGLHVYHYAAYEKTALRRLMGEHGTREDEIDDLLRQEVLVDLYRVVKQALRASVPSYSIKVVEELYGFERTAEVMGGDDSAVHFERWLELGDDALLEQIRLYNEEDCRSTVALHEWLLAQRPRDLPWRPAPEGRERPPEAEERDAERVALREALLDGATEGGPRRLLGHVLDYHRREAKPQWWEWFHHLTLDDEELVEDADTIGRLELDGEPELDKQSLVYPLRFPPQEHKLGSDGVDLRTEKSYSIHVDDEQGIVWLRRARVRADEPLPTGLVPPRPIADWVKRDALVRLARSYIAGDGGYPALVQLLERSPPPAPPGDDVVAAALALEHGYLFVQGPPGSGKTWLGAKAAVALMRAGRRVGVTALSHKAIHKFLHDVEEEAARVGLAFRGLKKCGDDDEDTAFLGGRGFVENTEAYPDLLDPAVRLVAGTTWVFPREDVERDGRVDVLFVDEAGQQALADVLAAGVSADRLVLLGDPNQLPQVSQGVQPGGAGASVLRHLLGEAETVPAERGIFLERTWRLRPELCAFTSEAYYEDRLGWAEPCERRTLAAGDGPVVLPVEHAGRSQSSWEEAEAVAGEIRALLGTSFTDEGGRVRPLEPADVLVVAPYNAQVRALRAKVPPGVRVGTVDKFQGQQAPVVLVSLASSSGADAPRGIGFVFDRHRVNVATSRAQCRAVLVCAPRLLEADCRTVWEMRLVNAVCRFVERAEASS